MKKETNNGVSLTVGFGIVNGPLEPFGGNDPCSDLRVALIGPGPNLFYTSLWGRRLRPLCYLRRWLCRHTLRVDTV